MAVTRRNLPVIRQNFPDSSRREFGRNLLNARVDQRRKSRRRSATFPDNFPVSTEMLGRDWFAVDCIVSQAVESRWEHELVLKAVQQRLDKARWRWSRSSARQCHAA